MTQAIQIDALGRIMSEHREDSPVNMAEFGDQDIVRFSEVLFDKVTQRWYVVFRDAAPAKFVGKVMQAGTVLAAGVPEDLYDLRMIAAVELGVSAPTFATYSDAVEAERAVLRWMMKTGRFHG